MSEPIVIKHRQHSTKEWRYVSGGTISITFHDNRLEVFEKSEADAKNEETGAFSIEKYYNRWILPKKSITHYTVAYNNVMDAFIVNTYTSLGSIFSITYSPDDLDKAENMLRTINDWYNK